MTDGEIPTGVNDQNQGKIVAPVPANADQNLTDEIQAAANADPNKPTTVTHVGKSPFEGITFPEGIEVTTASVPIVGAKEPVAASDGVGGRSGWKTSEVPAVSKPIARAINDIAALTSTPTAKNSK